jgi:hypothetical protein
MYATAHRVSRQGNSGINAFLHLHGRGFVWPADAADLPESTPGTLERTSTSIPPGGNPVHSYLDIIAPDSTPRSELNHALEVLRRDLSERRNPTIFSMGSVVLRFGVQLGLEPRRQAEFEDLAGAVQAILPEG